MKFIICLLNDSYRVPGAVVRRIIFSNTNTKHFLLLLSLTMSKQVKVNCLRIVAEVQRSDVKNTALENQILVSLLHEDQVPLHSHFLRW